MPINSSPITGLVAATFTPFRENGSVNDDLIPAYANHLAEQGISGLYICGSTGEGPSLSLAERKDAAAAWIAAVDGRMRNVVHVGHTSLPEAQELAAQASELGADAISAIAPYYFPVPDEETLAQFFREIVSVAPDLPFYYYHIPAITGSAVDPVRFLEVAGDILPTLRGIKFTDYDLSRFQKCQEVGDGRFDLLFGRDEMLLSGLASGAKGAVGSTYNLAPALYGQIIQAFGSGEMDRARQLQIQSIDMIRAVIAIGGEAALKYPMHRLGLNCGDRRLPMKSLSSDQKVAIDAALDAMNFDEWAVKS